MRETLEQRDERLHRKWAAGIERAVRRLWEDRRDFPRFYRSRGKWHRCRVSTSVPGCPCSPCLTRSRELQLDHWRITIEGDGTFLFRYLYDDQEKSCHVPLDAVLGTDIAAALEKGAV